MTESLKSLLEQQATSVSFKPPDLAAIGRDHGRRVRRRRAVTVVAGTAAIAAVATAAAVLWAGPDRQPEVIAGPGQAVAVSWAIGSTIHDGDDTIEVGHDVRAYVRTSVGFVTVDRASNVYSVTSRGVTRIGQTIAVPADGTGYQRLVSDPHGTLAGWMGAGQAGLAMLVHDQATGQTRSYPTAGAAAAGTTVFFAIDDRTVYWRNAPRAGVFAVDVDTGAERQLATGDPAGRLAIWSVENGMLAFGAGHQPGGNATSISVGRSTADARELTFGENAEASDQMRLSPTGAWLVYLLYQFNGPPQHDDVRAITAQVRDTGTGEVIALDLPGPSLAVPVVWLDDTTVQILVIGVLPGEGAQRARMYTCAVPVGTCAAAADLSLAEVQGTALVLPNGQSVDDE
jgi:hypothetical protein